MSQSCVRKEMSRREKKNGQRKTLADLQGVPLPLPEMMKPGLSDQKAESAPTSHHKPGNSLFSLLLLQGLLLCHG